MLKDGGKSPVPMKKIDEGFEVKRVVLSLSADGNILYFSGNEATRIANEEQEKLILEQQANNALCGRLDSEANLKSLEISDAGEWNKYVTELQDKKPKDCILKNADMKR